MQVGIIGAGVTGLGVAMGLEKARVPFTIFEKSRAIGGRMATWRVDGRLIPYGSPSWEGLPGVEELGPGFAKVWSEGFRGKIQFEACFEGFVEQGKGFLLQVGDQMTWVSHVVLTQPGPQLPDSLRPDTSYKTLYARVLRAKGGPPSMGHSIGHPQVAGIQCIKDWGGGVWGVYLTDETAPWEHLFDAPVILKAHRWRYAYPIALSTRVPQVPKGLFLGGDAWVGSDLGALWLRAEQIVGQILATT
jgi:hypothetical protein